MALSIAIPIIGPIILNKLKDKILQFLIDKGKEKLKPKIINFFKEKLLESTKKDKLETIQEFYDKLKDSLKKIDLDSGEDLVNILNVCLVEIQDDLNKIKTNIRDLIELTEFSFSKLQQLLNENFPTLNTQINEFKNEVIAELNKKSEFMLQKISDSFISEINLITSKLDKIDKKIEDVHKFAKLHERFDEERFAILVEKITSIEQKIETITTNINDQTETVRIEYNKTTKETIKIETNWVENFDTPEYKKLRRKMVQEILEEEGSKVNKYVIDTMLRVPRHIFVRDPKSEPYNSKKPFKVSKYQTESAPNVIALMLSMFPILPGDNILFIGAKGGYIQSLTAEIIGYQGKITVLSSDEEAISYNKEICKKTPYHSIIKWKLVNDPMNYKNALEDAPYNSIFICGRISSIPKYHLALLDEKGYLIAPIGDEENQIFSIIERSEDNYKIKEIEDFKLIFGPPI